MLCVEKSYLELRSYLVSIRDLLRTQGYILRMVEGKDAEFRSLRWMLGCAAQISLWEPKTNSPTAGRAPDKWPLSSSSFVESQLYSYHT